MGGAYGSMEPDNACGSMEPDNAYGSMEPDNVYGSMEPDNAYGGMESDDSDDDDRDADSSDKGIHTGKAEWEHNRPLFMVKVNQLLKIWGVKFPVNPIPHLSATRKRGLLREGSVISCLEDVCAVCSEQYKFLRNVKATALIPVVEVYCRVVLLSCRSQYTWPVL